MDLRHAMMGRRAMTAVAITTGLLLTVAGCGGSGGDDKSNESSAASSPTASQDDGGSKESSTPSADKVLATAKDGDITVTINSAQRDQGGFVTVAGQVTNGGSSSWLGADWQSNETELAGNGGSLSGASLVDEKGKKKYLVLRDTSGRCLCTKFSRLRPGDTASWFAQFPAPPDGTDTVSFQVGALPPTSVDLSEGE
ncbi:MULTISPECIES: hypothetical protein [unclassified Streptomyces]|uniref:hypothetical protein n=1 Tax=unclassified Streptomyces TaxID=2593676 RepID=UPI00225C15AC|nr:MULTISPECIES: hypothetical protein [unclassified Streptomyces]MCX5131160.1 hypothetical protein [Streptomyces sp. NBC_00340]